MKFNGGLTIDQEWNSMVHFLPSTLKKKKKKKKKKKENLKKEEGRDKKITLP
jgi:hypothetical protein